MRNEIITTKLSDAVLLEGFAEEAAELAQAALKLARVIRHENPTPVDSATAKEHLIEEIADVLLYEDIVSQKLGIEMREVMDTVLAKRERWLTRMEAIK